VVHRAPNDAFRGLVPYVVAMVELDEGPRMMTNLVGCPIDDVQVGMRLRVTFESDGPALPFFTPEDASA
jgi:uncharacterized OB-fold protein